MPDMPVAAPPAAPPPAAAAPSPAPVATPAASAPPATSAPVSPTAATPTAPAGPQPPKKLNPGDYRNATDFYLADTAYKQQLEAFKAEHPEVEIPVDKPAEAVPAADGTAAEQEPAEKPQEAVEEATETITLDEEPALTPQALNELIKAKPERAAYLETDPEFKNALFKLGREHAELSQFKGIYPTAESAKFAKETADRTVSLRTKFQTADTPEGMASAFDDFMQEFAIIGPDGKQVKGEDGRLAYADDLYALTEHIVNDRYIGSELADVEARLKANQYRSEDERTADNDRMIALKILRNDFVAQEPIDPDLSAIPENLRGDIQRRLDEAKAIEAKNKEKDGAKGKEARKAARTAANTEYFNEIGKRTMEGVTKTIDSLRKSGVLIPDWMLQTKIPGTQTPIFFSEIGKEVDKLIQSDPYTRKMSLELEAAPPTPENMKNRIQWYDGLMQRDGNLRNIVKKIVRGFGKDIQDQQAARPAPSTTAAPEPRGGGAPRPVVMTRDDAYRKAEQINAKEVQGWKSMSDAERMTYNLGKQRELLTAKR